MATIRYYDAAGVVTRQALLGETGYLAVEDLFGLAERGESVWSDSGSVLTQSIYRAGVLQHVAKYTYTTVTSPTLDKRITQVNLYDSSNTLLQQWQDLSFSLNEILTKQVVPVAQDEDHIIGNASNNYLQGALGDDLIEGATGDDTLEGGRADDTLVGGAGKDTLYGGLGTDRAAFSGASTDYTYAINTDGSLTFKDIRAGTPDGEDRLYDVEWLTFNYGTANAQEVLVSKLLNGSTSLISGHTTVNPTDPALFPDATVLVSEGNLWTFKNDVHTISWALADNGSYHWPDTDEVQDIIGDALEEFSKVADIEFQYFGFYSTVSAATASGVDFVYTLKNFSSTGTVAEAFFPNYADRTLDFGQAFVNYAANSAVFDEFLSFVALHETGHTLGLKHPHNASPLNPYRVGIAYAGADDGVSTLNTLMSYYNPSGISLTDEYYPTTPMVLDIIALQSLYGSTTDTGVLGDTTYAITSDHSYQTLVDLDGSSALDLRPANVGWYVQLEDDPANGFGWSQELANEYPNTQLVLTFGYFADAEGSGFGDSILGTDNANLILANGGNDFVWSYGGGDTLDGGDGSDTLIFTESVSDFVINYAEQGVLQFKKAGQIYALAANFEQFRFGYETANNIEISLNKLSKYITDSAATITATLSGVAKEDERLGVDIDVLDPDGVGTYTLQWQSKTATGAWTDITHATDATLSLGQTEVGKQLRVKVSQIDALGHATVAYSTASAAVQNINDAPTGLPTISGDLAVGATLTVNTASIQDEDGLGAFSYTWQHSANGKNWVDIQNASAVNYTITAADSQKSLRVMVKYADGFNTTESLTSAATNPVEPDNYAVTGRPTIASANGQIQEGVVLTAATNTIADKDGLGRFSYQWQAQTADGWTDIAGAKQATFTPTDAEVGLSLRIKVTFTDGRSHVESVYSEATAVVSNVNDSPTGGVRITGSQIEDETLNAEATLADEDGLGALSYQWQISANQSNWSDLTGAIQSTYTLNEAAVGKYYRVVASYTDAHGTQESVTSTPTQAIRNVNDAPEGSVTVTGTAAEDQSLTASHNLTDVDGLGTVALQWQYQAVTGHWVNIAGATASSYTLTDAEVGLAIRALAHYVDAHGTYETVASAGTLAVSNVNDAPTGKPLVTGDAQVDATLTASTAGIADADGILIVTDGIYDLDPFTYQWQRSSNGTSWVDIADGVEKRYTLTADDVSQQIRVVVNYLDLHGTAETLTSDALGAIQGTNQDTTGTVSISGNPIEDAQLTGTVANLGDADGLGTRAYQWQRSFGEDYWLDIAGANTLNYTLTDADVGALIRLTVAYTDGRGTLESLSSTATTAVTGVNDDPVGQVTVSGDLRQGGYLFADTFNLSDADGLGIFKYQWQRSADNGTTYQSIQAATDAIYELTNADVGALLRVTVSYKDAQGFRNSVVSTATTAIADVNDAPTGRVSILGVGREDTILSLNTNALADADGLGEFLYTWQRSTDGTVWYDRSDSFKSTLTLDDRDVGAYLRAKVDYVDAQGHFETVYSDTAGPVTAVNDPLLGELRLTGILASGQTLSVDTAELYDLDGLGTPGFTWSTSVSGDTWTQISAGSAATYTLQAADIGKLLRVQMTLTDGQGFTETAATQTTRSILGSVSNRTADGTLTGGNQDERVIATDLNDDILAGGGNDEIDAGEGADVIDAGEGDDIIVLTPDGVWTTGFKAARFEYAAATGTAGAIVEYVDLAGRNRFFDVIDGNNGADTIQLADTFNGDAFFLHDFFSDFNGSAQAGFVVDMNGDSGTSRLGAIERILGGQGDDIIDITSPDFAVGDLELQGNDGADVLWGSDGDDTLDGGRGSDAVAGGRGHDVFVLRLGEGASQIADADHVRDFKLGEDFFSLAGGLTFANLSVTAAADTEGNNKVVIQHKTTGEIYALIDNLNASQAADLTQASFIAATDDERISLTGTATQGQTLTVDTSLITRKAAGTDYAIQWQIADAEGNWITVSEGASSTYPLTQASVGHSLRAEVIFRDTYGYTRSYVTEGTAPVANLNDAPTGQPVLTGTLVIGGRLSADLSALADLDGLGPVTTAWQSSGNGAVWTDIPEGSDGLPLTADLLDQRLRVKATYTDGWGTQETVYSTASDPVYGFAGTRVVFPRADDLTTYSLAIDKDLRRANSFAIDYTFSYDPTAQNQSHAGKDQLTQIAIQPTLSGSSPLTVNVTTTQIDVGYSGWLATEGSALIGNVLEQGSYTLTAGTYRVHVDLKSLNDYQDFIGVIYRQEDDGTWTAVGTTAASINAPVFTQAKDYRLYVDGGYDSGVAALDNFRVTVSRLAKGADDLEGTPDDDLLYGTAQADVLYGFAGDDEIYGLSGNDTIYGGEGNNLVIAGAGDDELIGGAGNDTLLGDSGNDNIKTGAGNDVVNSGLGDDTITVDGIGAKTIDGGSGANTLSISSVSGLGDFTTRSVTDQSWLFSYSNGDEITFKNIFVLDTSYGKSWWGGSITVGGKTYTLADDMRGDSTPFSGAYGSVRAFVYQSGDTVDVALIEGGKFIPQYRMNGFAGFSLTGNETYTAYGTAGKDIVFTGYMNDVIEVGDGNDFIFAGDGSDTIRAGSGDDVVYLSYTALTEDAVIDGGAGSNTLAFIKPGESGGWDNDSYSAITVNMANLGVATGFQNIVGTAYDDTITGDANANVLIGNSGNDAIDGGSGNDTIYGDYHEGDSAGNSFGLNYYWAQSQGKDTLYGGAGRDQLFGSNGDDYLDGGTDADTLKGGGGIDTFVLRVGDGGSSIATADVITDFTDGTDVFGLATGLLYSDLLISQGDGSNTAATNAVIKKSSGEYLAVVQNTTASSLNYYDFASLATGAQTLTGSSGDDVLIGAAGNDTFTTGIGTDVILGNSGDDTITVDGIGAKTIDGGTGTNTLLINYGGLTGLADLSLGTVTNQNNATWTLTDGDTTISFKNILQYIGGDFHWDGYLTVADKTYRFVTDYRSEKYPWEGAYGSVQGFVYQSGTDVEVVLPSGGLFNPSYRMSGFRGFSLNGSENYKIYGSTGSEILKGGYQSDTLFGGDGNDHLYGGDGADSIFGGAGNDVIYLSSTALTEDLLIDGGSGANTLAFRNIGGWDNDTYAAVTFNLATDLGHATNIQNVSGSDYADNLTGDASNNLLIGGGGADVLNGSQGDDTLFGDYHTSDSMGLTYGVRQYQLSEGNDTLYGGAGNDSIVGNAGDDLLDGGAGVDTLSGGSGIDTFVLRVGDGGSSIATADVITDFTDGTDVLLLADGLVYNQLSFVAGSGTHAGNTFVMAGSEYLVELVGVSSANLSITDFTS